MSHLLLFGYNSGAMDKSKKRLIASLVLNAVVFLIECYAISNSAFGYARVGSGSGQGYLMFRFFTEDSNIVLGISSLLYVVFAGISLKKGTEIPFWLRRVRLIAVTAVTTTFMVVFFFLAPYTGYAYGRYWLMWSLPNMTFTHFVCPVSSVISFLYLEKEEGSPLPSWKEAFFGLISVLLYVSIMIPLASSQLISSDETVNNVYGFMDATANPWWVSVLAVTSIVGGTYLEAFLLALFQKKIAARRTQKSLAKPV
jgi:hypothetical protein